MRKHLPALFLIAVLCTLAASAAFAGPKGVDRPHRFGHLDSGLVRIDNPADGRVWAAWSYRNGAEFDVAVASTDADGVWSEPTLLGLDDGRDQIDPSLSADADGRVYLVYTDRSNQRILARSLDPATGQWSAAGIVATARGIGSPIVKVYGNRVAVAYRVGRRVELADFARPGSPELGTNGTQDGPDPFGSKDEDEEEEGNDEQPEDESNPETQPIGQGSNERNR